MGYTVLFILGALVGFVATFPPIHVEYLRIKAEINNYQAKDCELQHCSKTNETCKCRINIMEHLKARISLANHEVQTTNDWLESAYTEIATSERVEYDPLDTFITQLVAKINTCREILKRNGVEISPPDVNLIVPVAELKKDDADFDDPFGF